MRTMNPKIAIPLAIIFGLFAFGINHYLLKPVPMQEQNGVVKNIEFFEEGVMERTTTHTGRNAGGGSTTTHLKIPSRFIYTIELEDHRMIRYAENAHFVTSARSFEIGEPVHAKYEVRKVPFMDESVRVHEVTKIGE